MNVSDFRAARSWPDRFPTVRVVLGVIFVPATTLYLLTGISYLGLLISSIFHVPAAQQIGIDGTEAFLRVSALYFVYSWPAYVTFTVAGVPTIWLLFRRKVRSVIVFTVIGALYATLAFFLLLETSQARPGAVVTNMAASWVEAITGAIEGLLTWLIIFTTRRPVASRL